MLKTISILLLLSSFIIPISRDEIYDSSWAILIGINNYQTVTPNLEYAVDDAQDIQELLIDLFEFPEENITFLKNEQATKQNIRKAFDNVRKKAGKKDRVLIFFAGHGETIDLPEGGEMGYLLPYDTDKESLYLTAIPMNEFKDFSTLSNSKHLLFLLDACYGGLAASTSRGLTVETPDYIEKISRDKSRQIITAGGRGEQVVEKPEWGNSVFTMNLLRGLQGRADYDSDGAITTNELYTFLQRTVSEDSENAQTPKMGRYGSYDGEFVFIYSDNVTINQVTTNASNESNTPSANIDYDLLASKIAREMKQGSEPPVTQGLPITDKEREEQILETMFNDIDMDNMPTFLDEENYSNGITKYKHSYNPEKKRHGSQEGYYSNGITKYKYNFLMGKAHGEQIGYYSNGITKYKYNFFMGKLDGIQNKYKSNGIIQSESAYIKDELISGSQIDGDDMHQMYGDGNNDEGISIGEGGINIGNEDGDGISIGEDGVAIGGEGGVSIGEGGINIGNEDGDGISIGEDGISIGGEDGINLDFSRWKERFAQEDEDDDEDSEDDEEDSGHTAERSWHMVTSSSTMLSKDNEIDRFSTVLMGASWDITPNLDLQVGGQIVEDDSNDYSFQGLRLGLRFKIIEDLKGQVGVSTGYTEFDRTYSGESWSNPYHFGGPSYIFDLGLITHIVWFDVLFSVGYNLNDMQISISEEYSDVVNGFFFALGVEWFPWD